jgi:hypothetical protein
MEVSFLISIIFKCSLFQVHPVRVGGELEIEKENKVKFFIQNLKLLPNNGVEHGNETLFEKVILY